MFYKTIRHLRYKLIKKISSFRTLNFKGSLPLTFLPAKLLSRLCHLGDMFCGSLHLIVFEVFASFSKEK